MVAVSLKKDFFQAEDGIRDLPRSRGLGDVYKRQAFGWAGLFLAHIGLIFAVYMTFKQFHRAEEKSASVFQTKNFDPFKIMVIVFVIVFIFVFSKGIEVLTSPNPNSYSIPYDGPLKSAIEKWLPFSKDK